MGQEPMTLEEIVEKLNKYAQDGLIGGINYLCSSGHDPEIVLEVTVGQRVTKLEGGKVNIHRFHIQTPDSPTRQLARLQITWSNHKGFCSPRGTFSFDIPRKEKYTLVFSLLPEKPEPRYYDI